MTSTGRLTGKVALITGGSSGIGLAAAQLFLAEGAKVVIADLQQPLDEKSLATYARQWQHVRCDVTNEAEIRAAMAVADDVFGGLDIAYHNAGAVGDRGAVDDIALHGWDSTMRLLLTSSMLVVKHATPLLRARGGGAVVLTSSAAATSLGGTGQYAYSVAKSGVIHLAQYTALKLAKDRIRVNVLVPGSIQTPIWRGLTDGPAPERDFSLMQPLPQAGTPRDVAEAGLYLAADSGTFITGVALPVDGGLSLYRPARHD